MRKYDSKTKGVCYKFHIKPRLLLISRYLKVDLNMIKFIGFRLFSLNPYSNQIKEQRKKSKCNN
jgi:hypothetical protein